MTGPSIIRVMAICAALSLPATAGAARIKTVPKVNANVGGANTAAVGALGPQSLSPPTLGAVPSLGGATLNAAPQAAPVAARNAPVGAAPAGPAAAPASPVGPRAQPQAAENIRTAPQASAQEGGQDEAPAPKVGAQGLQQELTSVREGSRELGGIDVEIDFGEEAAGTGAVMFDNAAGGRGAVSAGTQEQGRPGSAQFQNAVARFEKYMRAVAGGIRLRQDQRRGLLIAWMEDEARIARNSPLWQALLARYAPEEAAARVEAARGVDQQFRGRAGIVVEAAEENNVPVATVQRALRKYEVDGPFVRTSNDRDARRIVNSAVNRYRLESFASVYPDNSQGRFLKDMVHTLLQSGGKSVEEIARDGAFAYVNFSGRAVVAASTGRDPDPTAPHVLYYLRLEDGKWRIGVYRQNRGAARRMDDEYVKIFTAWLRRGGIPESHFP